MNDFQGCYAAKDKKGVNSYKLNNLKGFPLFGTFLFGLFRGLCVCTLHFNHQSYQRMSDVLKKSRNVTRYYL
jgi:hypothetical protein